MKIANMISALEALAHPALQEAYDNAGLIIGDKNAECSGVLVCLDVTEDIVLEARRKKCNLIVAHHPIVFKGLKRITGSSYVERIVADALRNDISIYAIHTNLDNVLHGVNSVLAGRLQLQNCRVLAPRENGLRKLEVFVPDDHAENVRQALFQSGAGAIGPYHECSFNTEGTGTFTPLQGASPFSGNIGERFAGKEVKIEVIYPAYQETILIQNLRNAHPYEKVAYYITRLDNTENETGSGMIGELPDETTGKEFLLRLKQILNIPVLRHTALLDKPIRSVAFCGGSGFFLLKNAMAARADVYITADIKYHEFFDADQKILVVDAGHFETEQFTIQLLAEYLQNNFPNFAVLKTEHQTNPVHYLT